MSNDKSGNIPNPPDYAKTFQQGIDVYLKNLPQLLQTEEDTRQSTDPQRIADQQALQAFFGPTQYQQQLDALHQFDPESASIRASLAKSIQGDLDTGYDLPPALRRQLQQSVRGAQTARGNAFGQGAEAVESSVATNAAQGLYQQHLQNAGNFLAGPTPEQQALAIQAVQPDRSFAYANPGAGTQGVNFGLQNYTNLLAQNQLVANKPSPWGSALAGGATGAAAGSSFGPYGALIGGVVGAGAGYFGSDENIKEGVTDTGEVHRGVRVVEFNYKGNPQRFRGVIAQEVEKLFPSLVKIIDGVRFVDYNSLGLRMRAV